MGLLTQREIQQAKAIFDLIRTLIRTRIRTRIWTRIRTRNLTLTHIKAIFDLILAREAAYTDRFTKATLIELQGAHFKLFEKMDTDPYTDPSTDPSNSDVGPPGADFKLFEKMDRVGLGYVDRKSWLGFIAQTHQEKASKVR